jgi:GNAT superfamily N-acetyltransferase
VSAHPLLATLIAAASGRFPSPDGLTDVIPAPPGRSDAVVGFTAHHLVAADVPADEVLAHLPSDDVAAAMDARFLTWLGERLGSAPGVLDAVLAADPLDGEADLRLTEITASDHPRVLRASTYRTELRVYEDERHSAVLTIGRGLASRLEVSIEVDPVRRDAGLGRAMAEAARTLAPAGEPLFAQVSPGNAASLRAFLAAGFRPIGSEVLFLRTS